MGIDGIFLNIHYHVVKVEVANGSQIFNHITLGAAGLHLILVLSDDLKYKVKTYIN